MFILYIRGAYSKIKNGSFEYITFSLAMYYFGV